MLQKSNIDGDKKTLSFVWHTKCISFVIHRAFDFLEADDGSAEYQLFKTMN